MGVRMRVCLHAQVRVLTCACPRLYKLLVFLAHSYAHRRTNTSTSIDYYNNVASDLVNSSVVSAAAPVLITV